VRTKKGFTFAPAKRLSGLFGDKNKFIESIEIDSVKLKNK